MTDSPDTCESRRRFLKVASGALILPVTGLTACSGGDNAGTPPAAAPAQPESTPQATPEPVSPPPAAPADENGLTRLEEDDPLAQALSYVHDAADVDASKFTQYEAGQACSNCAQYLGVADAEWAACAIFPGRLVKNTGWCSVYVRRPA